MTKTREVKIEKIVLRIGDKEINLSVQEARELRDILNSNFGERIIERYHDLWYWQPYTHTHGSSVSWTTSLSGSNVILCSSNTST